MDSESSAHPEETEYQDAVVTSDPEGHEDMDADLSFLPEGP